MSPIPHPLRDVHAHSWRCPCHPPPPPPPPQRTRRTVKAVENEDANQRSSARPRPPKCARMAPSGARGALTSTRSSTRSVKVPTAKSSSPFSSRPSWPILIPMVLSNSPLRKSGWRTKRKAFQSPPSGRSRF